MVSSMTARARQDLLSLADALDAEAQQAQEHMQAFEALTGRILMQRVPCHPSCYVCRPVDEDAYASKDANLQGLSGHVRVAATAVADQGRASIDRAAGLLGQACLAMAGVPLPVPRLSLHLYVTPFAHQKALTAALDPDTTMWGVDGSTSYADLFCEAIDLSPRPKDPWFLFDGTIWRKPMAVQASTLDRARRAYTLLVSPRETENLPPIAHEGASRDDLMAFLAHNDATVF